jgi:Transposase DDE domain
VFETEGIITKPWLNVEVLLFGLVKRPLPNGIACQKQKSEADLNYIRISQFDVPLKAPDYTTLCIRQKELKVSLQKSHKKSSEWLHIVVDYIGLKVFGEGEWKV